MTSRCGLSTLNTNAGGAADDAAGVGDHAPAAAGRRPCASASISATVSSPWLRRSISSSAPVEAAVSRQPRLPQRQTAPSRVDEDVAELAGHAARAAVQPPVEDQPGADAGRELDDRRGRSRRGPRRGSSSASAPRFASLSTLTGTSSRRRISSPAATPTQPGQDRRGADHAVGWSTGPGSPRPAPITRERSTPGLGEQPRRSASSATSRPSCAAWSVSIGAARSARMFDDRSLTATRTWLVAEVDAERGAGRGVERQQDRRAAALLAVGGAGLGALRRAGRRTAGRRRGSRRSSARGRCGARSRRG